MTIRCTNIEYARVVFCPCCGEETSADCGLDDIEDQEVEIPDDTPKDKMEEVIEEALEEEVGNNIGSFEFEIVE